MGFEVHVPDDGAKALPVATCDRTDCWRPIGPEAVVLFASDADVSGDFWFKLFLACSLDCAQGIRRDEGQTQTGEQVAWASFGVAHYWIAIGAQLGLLSLDRWGQMREFAGAAA